jgi:hypothetical protein
MRWLVGFIGWIILEIIAHYLGFELNIKILLLILASIIWGQIYQALDFWRE